MSELIKRTAAVIAMEINTIKDETKKILLFNSIEIGRKLAEAKTLVPHGEWGTWLEESVDYKKSTADNLIKIFEKYGSDQITLIGDNAKTKAIGELSYTQAVVLLGIKDDIERETFIEEHKDEIKDSSTRELKEMIKERDKLKKENAKLQKEVELNKSTVKKNEEMINKMLFDKNKLQDEMEKVKKEMEDQAYERTVKYSREVERLNKELQEIKNNPIEVVGIDEGKEEEYKKKEEELKKQHEEEIKALEEKLSSTQGKLNDLQDKENDEGIIKFRLYFESLKTDINNLLGAIEDIKDKDAAENYKNALSKTLDVIKGRI